MTTAPRTRACWTSAEPSASSPAIAPPLSRATRPKDLGKVAALTIGDVNGDGSLDLLVLRANGAILRISDKNDGRDWDVSELARWEKRPDCEARLLVADLDNYGGVDLLGVAPGESRT